MTDFQHIRQLRKSAKEMSTLCMFDRVPAHSFDRFVMTISPYPDEHMVRFVQVIPGTSVVIRDRVFNGITEASFCRLFRFYGSHASTQYKTENGSMGHVAHVLAGSH